MNIVIDVNAKCRECGRDLDCKADLDRNGNLAVEVDPCSRCLDGARAEGEEAGRKAAEAKDAQADPLEE